METQFYILTGLTIVGCIVLLIAAWYGII